MQPVCAGLPGAAGPSGWVGYLNFLLSFFLPFPSPKARVIYFFFPSQVQVETEVEQREGGTANPSCGPGARRLGRQESPLKGRG